MDKTGFQTGCVWGVRERDPGDFQVSGHCNWVGSSNVPEGVISGWNTD